jgi:hypothetical protein
MTALCLCTYSNNSWVLLRHKKKVKLTVECLNTVLVVLLLLLLQVCLAQGSSVNSVLDVRVTVNTGALSTAPAAAATAAAAAAATGSAAASAVAAAAARNCNCMCCVLHLHMRCIDCLLYTGFTLLAVRPRACMCTLDRVVHTCFQPIVNNNSCWCQAYSQHYSPLTTLLCAALSLTVITPLMMLA